MDHDFKDQDEAELMVMALEQGSDILEQRITALETENTRYKAALEAIRDKELWGFPLDPSYSVAAALTDIQGFVTTLKAIARAALEREDQTA